MIIAYNNHQGRFAFSGVADWLPKLKSIGLLCLVVTICTACSVTANNASDSALNTPNFIVILADDLGWSSLSVSMDKKHPNAKSDYHKTPNIDSIVDSGLRFSNGYAASPVCLPHAIVFSLANLTRIKRTRGLGKNHTDVVGAIPQVLKSIDKSYRAAHIGKWHIDKDPSVYGYDVHDGVTRNKAGGFINNQTQWHGYVN